ncbi:MAG: type II toxin-antitoxin system VapC family toxin [Burkholderiales bacterium]|nr:type II toxin-antitoxin system VapC family toxin [Burkholderiales bacterium]
MSLVIDSSIALAWLFEDEQSEATEALLRRVVEQGAIVPSLWRLEVANALQMALRRKRIDASFRDASLQDFLALPIIVDADTDAHAFGTTLSLAQACGLTLYDAAYLELAQRLRLPLATLDGELRAACRSMKVDILPD